MKTLLTSLFLLFMCLNMTAQQNNIYIKFNGNNDTTGIMHLPVSGKFDTNKFRCESHFFTLTNRVVHFYGTFAYINPTNKPDNPIIIKPLSYLESVEYIDFDAYTKGFSLGQYYDFLKSLETYDNVYFIDRSEIKDGMMKMYPVKEFRAAY